MTVYSDDRKGLASPSKLLWSFSDPYCILGIVPGRGIQDIEASYEDEPQCGNAPRPSLQMDQECLPSTGRSSEGRRFSLAKPSIKRFGRSLRRHVDRGDTTSSVGMQPARSKTLSLKDRRIPAKILRYTAVIENTLEPVWNERFQFEVDDYTADKLHLDIWDHDEETSVMDAVCSLNEVRGVKQLGRYFKQVSQSARKGQAGDLDDFLGCINIDLKDIPSAGIEQWIKLQGRSAKSKVQGEIRIGLKLTARDEKGRSEHKEMMAVREHVQLLYNFILHELRCSKLECLSQSFKLFTERALMLITQCQVVFSADYPENLQHLECLLKCLKSLYSSRLFQFCHPFCNTLQCELIAALKKRTKSNYEILKTSKLSEEEEDWTGSITDSEARMYVTHFNRLSYELHAASETYSPIFERQVDVNLADLIQKVYAGMINEDLLIKHELDKLVEKLKAKDRFPPEPVKNEVRRRTSVQKMDENRSTIFESIQLGNTALYELFWVYCTLAEFEQHPCRITEPSKDAAKEDVSWYSWFRPVLYAWIARCSQALMNLVENSIDADQLDVFPQSTKCDGKRRRSREPLSQSCASTETILSPSASQTVTNLAAILRIWQSLNWPDQNTRPGYEITLTQIICECALTYAKQLNEKLRLQGYCDEQGQFDISDQLCVGLNNLYAVRKLVIELPQSFEVLETPTDGNSSEEMQDKDFPSKTQQFTFSRKLPDKLLEIHQNGVSEISRVLERVLYRVTAKAAYDLMFYLESNLMTFRQLVSQNLLKQCFLTVWDECLQQFIEQVNKEADFGSGFVGPGAYLSHNSEDPSKGKFVIPLATHFTDEQGQNQAPDLSPESILRSKATLTKLKQALELLIDFFVKIGDKQINRNDLQNENFQDVNYLIKLYLSTTPELVELYFTEKIVEQESTVSTSYGSLSVKVYLQRSSLTVEVISATGLIPLDSNGLSDPFVIVELAPRHIFAQTPKPVRTRVVKNSLEPQFNEKFEFNVSAKEITHPAACVAFIVMDHDLLLSDDLEGCTFLRLSSLFQIKDDSAADESAGKSRSTASSFCVLPILRPVSKKHSALNVLSQRTDTYAQEIFKKWQSMELDTTA
ncbi:unnamed protein product [Calicophoron daubneyi]|uniref:BAI1-associated protein 3 n=1 Tax=Calicophoron daubneyi TaxID=300641 RepID=A0AAV2THX8_CALDB